MDEEEDEGEEGGDIAGAAAPLTDTRFDCM